MSFIRVIIWLYMLASSGVYYLKSVVRFNAFLALNVIDKTIRMLLRFFLTISSVALLHYFV